MTKPAQMKLVSGMTDANDWRELALELAGALYSGREDVFLRIVQDKGSVAQLRPVTAALVKAERVLQQNGAATDIAATPRGELTLTQTIAWRAHFGELPDAITTSAFGRRALK